LLLHKVRENGEGRKEERFSEHSSRLSGNPENLFSSARYPSLFPKTLRQTSDLFFAAILSEEQLSNTTEKK